MSRRLAERLSSIIGDGKVYTDPNIVALYTREPVGLEGASLAVVFPETVDDVRAAVRLAYRERVPIYPQGSATSLSGSSLPEGGFVVSMERMKSIREISLVDSVAVVEPGVRIGELNQVLAGKGYMFPVDPASQAVATVGGAVNSGAGGMRGAKYGTMRDWVNMLSIVLADEDATLARIGCRTVKCRQGYDLVRLIVGSEGTLAVVVEATLRIAPLPETAPTVLAFFPRTEGPLDALAMLKEEASLQPLIAEYMDAKTVEWASRGVEVAYEPSGHMLLLSVEANKEAVDRMLSMLVDTMRRAGADRIYTAASLGEAEEKGLFRVRRNLFHAQASSARSLLGKPDVQVLIEDIVVPPSRLLDAVEGIRRLEEEYGLPTFLGGHIGDGNLHPSVGYDPGDPSMTEKVHAWFRDVMKLALSLGGSVSAEHGIGLLKREGLRMEFESLGSTRPLELMKGIKAVFDPRGILNPGKIIG